MPALAVLMAAEIECTTWRKSGGQQGHPVSTLAQVARKDLYEELRHGPVTCSGCGAGLVGAPEIGVERLQVFDLPPIKIRVTELSTTEHQLVSRRYGQ
jgi:transposase